MGADFKRSWYLVKKNLHPWPEGEQGLKVRDHRRMVGGAWEEIGRLQFSFMKKEGLRPEHVLLDIGCGSFRSGRLFIEYLEPGNYLGIDKQPELVREGRVHEVGERLWAEKRPQVLISDEFDFVGFSKSPDFALAQSLFTHLSMRDVKKCLRRLKDISTPHCKVYATFFEAKKKVWNLLSSHSSRRFEYTVEQMRGMGERTGWKMTYIGDWGHPRNQSLVVYQMRE
jgi:SAM-dependent methyltransferase